ncbi:M20 family metallopeptidase [Planosporangium flavigriseum]|uniref:Glutamate carboxypeptidase n=2 Tax=Planosporangium flavigriseum TaxID=373681 RepID=A0A8J3LMG0_9ACTN|nr:M20 family metallopeptidase [Planosporangium flavigriseum]GIG75432.1 glutamate carboxypeptidase [Planosporangium flavigriseum]
MVGVLEDLVMTETPSNDGTLIKAGIGMTAALVRRLLGETAETVEVDGRPHLRLRGGSANPVLVLCHLDTVWPAGTTRRWPFHVADGRASGPGVFDMKAGLVQALYALRSVGCADRVTLLITSDEEIGSPSSRALIEEEARGCRAALVFEPSANGALKTARKGTSMYRLLVEGRAAHAGLEPQRGVNALVELAHQVQALAALGDASVGTSVTPTTASAGTTMNTVPASALVDVDVRAWTAEEQSRVHEALSRLRPVLPGAALHLTGGVNRPPLESEQSATLADLADRCAQRLGLPPLGRAEVGGASDGNFTAALGVPTLDGLGAVGGNAHAEGEYVDTRLLGERAELICAVLEELTADDWGAE